METKKEEEKEKLRGKKRKYQKLKPENDFGLLFVLFYPFFFRSSSNYFSISLLLSLL